MKDCLSKEVVSDEGNLVLFVTRRAGLTEGVVFHEGALLKGVLLYYPVLRP